MDRRDFIRTLCLGGIGLAIPGCIETYHSPEGQEQADRLVQYVESLDSGFYMDAKVIVASYTSGKSVKIHVNGSFLSSKKEDLEVKIEHPYEKAQRLVILEDIGLPNRREETVDKGIDGVFDYYSGIRSMFSMLHSSALDPGYMKDIQENYIKNLKTANDIFREIVSVRV